MVDYSAITNNLPIPAKLVSYITANPEITDYFKQLADKIEEMNNNIIMVSAQVQDLNARVTVLEGP